MLDANFQNDIHICYPFLLVWEERRNMVKTKKFIKPLYDTTIKYLVKSTDTRYIIYRFIYLATGIDLSDYTLIDKS